MVYENNGKIRIEEQDGNDIRVRYKKTIDGYEYIIKIPEFLNFQGRMLINEVPDPQEENPVLVGLTVYTQFLHPDEYMVDVIGVETKYSTVSIRFMVDKDGTYLPYEDVSEDKDKMYRELAEQYQDKIKKLLECAEEMFE